jgi:hypothetical protein
MFLLEVVDPWLNERWHSTGKKLRKIILTQSGLFQYILSFNSPSKM